VSSKLKTHSSGRSAPVSRQKQQNLERKERQMRGKCEEQRGSQEKRPGGATRRGGLVREEGILRPPKPPYAGGLPRKVAKISGTPKSLMAGRSVVGARALRASRSSHERRSWARCARDRIPTELCGSAGVVGGRVTSTRWWREPRPCRRGDAAGGSNPSRAGEQTQPGADATAG